jgi:hypothetical protein
MTACGGSQPRRHEEYRATVNAFVAEGGDRFFVLRSGSDRTGGALDSTR